MKKILLTSITIVLITTLTSCHDRDRLIGMVIDQSQNELNNYNQILRMTKDTNVISFIDSLKRNEMKNAYEVKGAIEASNTFITPYDSSIKKINIYIDSVKK